MKNGFSVLSSNEMMIKILSEENYFNEKFVTYRVVTIMKLTWFLLFTKLYQGGLIKLYLAVFEYILYIIYYIGIYMNIFYISNLCTLREENHAEEKNAKLNNANIGQIRILFFRIFNYKSPICNSFSILYLK